MKPLHETELHSGLRAVARRFAEREIAPHAHAWDESNPRPPRHRANVLHCEKCKGRLTLMAMVTDPKSIARYLGALGEPTEPPLRTPRRGPSHWKSTVLRRRARGDVA